MWKKNIPHYKHSSLTPFLFKGEGAGIGAAVLALMLLVSIVSCRSSKQVEVVERVKTDTLYRSNIKYDSIFIHNDRTQELHLNPLNLSNHLNPDTLLIKEVSVEFRYKLLRDTCYIHKVDSVPVVQTVQVVKEVSYNPWYTKALAWIGAICLLLIAIFVAIKLTKH